ncbi:MAG: alpha-mannosidase [Dysgonamonadaceae bacterium]|jgi:alpha-mannosidase|nr:alpha-mannosidase [Dysgonamonadaceae bacterium]
MRKLIFLFICFCLISTAKSQKPYKAYMVSNAHFDTNWLWTVQTSIDDYLYRTMMQNFWLMDNYPEYVFNFEGAVKYSWMKEYYPSEYEHLKKYVKSGQWNIVGSSWDANDPNMPSSESFIRNVLLGQTFYKNEFSKKSNDIFLPDCFGFGITLPTLAHHCGLIGFSTQKLQWRKLPFYDGNKKVPFLIGIWEGLDGSRIMSIPHAQSYVTRYEYKDLSRDEELIKLAEQDSHHIAYHYYGVGDRGGSPQIASVASVIAGIKGDGPVEIVSSPAGKIFDDFSKAGNDRSLPVFKGELLMDVHATGCYTSQAAMKLFNRRNEQLADAAERISVIAEWLGGLKYPSDAIRTEWKRFLWHQFHDDMTGTSIPAVYKNSWNDELISQTKFAEITADAVGSISAELNTQTSGTPLVIYNPLTYSRKDIVTATVDHPDKTAVFFVSGPKGEKTPAQIINRKDGKIKLIFATETPPLSVAVYDVKQGGLSTAKYLKASANTLENKIYRITLDKNGDISSIIDKRENRELVKSGNSFRLALFSPDVSTSWPAWEIMKETMDQDPSTVSENVKITVSETGPVRATLKVERESGKSNFVQYISLTEGADDARIDIRNEIDWNETNTLLKAEFPMNVTNEKARYDLGIGYIERGNNTPIAYEIYAQQWADITDNDGSYGITVMNDCKYGWDKPDDNTLRLTLLHTPKVGTDPNMTHQDHLDIGHHTIRYSIYGHRFDSNSGRSASIAESMNQPLIPFIVHKHKGKLGKSFSFISADSPQIAIKAIKKAEDESSYVIRINEIQGKEVKNARLKFASAIESAVELNGIEEYAGEASFKGNELIFDANPFQPRTFGIKLKSNPILTQSKNIYVDLEHNATAVTPDEFNKAGNFDGEGNSISAELLPEVIKSGSVDFKINNRPNEYNYIRCNGQSVKIPKTGKSGKLYLLLTSTRGDRKATFTLDGKKYSFNIPFYSGYYGQWGWKGESEGYLKDGSIAWIGTHRHSEKYGNESYTYTYLYKICIDIDENSETLILPEDAGIAVFAATVNYGTYDSDAILADEIRATPYISQETVYTDRPVQTRRR